MVQIIYTVLALWLSIYGFQSLLLTFLYLRHRRQAPIAAEMEESSWPAVVVQLPIYNEQHVVERLIDAAAALDYPRDRLEIQVLDDSTDETTELARERVALYQREGFNIELCHRDDRAGFKAGALALGLAQTSAAYVAVFDADFCPGHDFLRKVIPHLSAHPEIGVVQTRWSHLNEIYSPLTRAQSLALDGHFVVEQTARNRSGLLMSFNGSGGIWRRECIDDAGGWQTDTMTEDMDLSYRAQLAGWSSLFLVDVEAPAELPPQLEAFQQQQARWAQGSMQCMRKLGRPILRSGLTVPQKVMALVHISSYLAHPLMIGLLLVLPVILWMAKPLPMVLSAAALASFGPPLMVAISQSALHKDWKTRVVYAPVLGLVAVGIAWSTTQAVWQGLTRWGGTFTRTPKFRLEGRAGRWSHSRYRLTHGAPVGEILLAAYAAAAAIIACLTGNFGALPFLLLCGLGFGLVGSVGFLQSRAQAGG